MTEIETVASRVAKVIKRRLRDTVSKVYELHEADEIAVALSGGVDSCSILAECLRQGHKPTVISYSPDTHISTDYKMAKQTAENYGLEFISVRFPMEAKLLEEYARYVMTLGYTHKVGVECLVPLVRIIKVAQDENLRCVFTGDQSDGYFALARWAGHAHDASNGVAPEERQGIRDDTTSERIDAIRARYWDIDKSCSNGVKAIGLDHDVKVVVPYRDRKIYDAFQGTLWVDVNKPRPKEPIRLAYEDSFHKTKVWVRGMAVNLHRGDSRFADMMGEILMGQEHLQGPWKSVRGLYLAMAAGEV